MIRYERKLAAIRAGNSRRGDFIIADAKDGDMGLSITATGSHHAADGSVGRMRTRREFLDEITAIVEQDVLDIKLLTASNLELLSEAGVFRNSAVQPAIRANDATDCWGVRHGRYTQHPSRPFRTATLARVLAELGDGTLGGGGGLTDLGLYSIAFNNDLDADVRSLTPTSSSAHSAAARATRDTFELICLAERYGARDALFGRKINLVESQRDIVSLLRRVADGEVGPAEAVCAYHGTLQQKGIRPVRSLEDDLIVTQLTLKQAA